MEKEVIGYIAFNTELRRPGCVLVQASMGGTFANFDLLFPADTWLVSPAGCRLYPITSQEQIDKLVEMSIKAVRKP